MNELFNTLMKKESVKMEKFLLNKFRKLSHEDVQDVIQITMILALNNFHTLRDHNKLKSWVYSGLVNNALNYNRTKNRRRQEDINDFDGATNSTAEMQYINIENKRILDGLIGDLPAKQRQAVELHFGEGLSQTEIAKLADCTTSTAKANWRHGMLTIKEKINKRKHDLIDIEEETLYFRKETV